MTSAAARPSESDEIHRIYSSPAFQRLEARRSRLSWWFTGVAVGVYVAFFVAVAVAPNHFGDKLAGFGSVGILVVVALFLVAFVMVGLFLRITRRGIVPEQAEVAAQLTGRGEQR